MILIPANFSSHKMKYMCECGEKETMRHLYVCTYWNTTNESDDYDWIFTDSVKQKYSTDLVGIWRKDILIQVK